MESLFFFKAKSFFNVCMYLFVCAYVWCMSLYAHVYAVARNRCCVSSSMELQLTVLFFLWGCDACVHARVCECRSTCSPDAVIKWQPWPPPSTLLKTGSLCCCLSVCFSIRLPQDSPASASYLSIAALRLQVLTLYFWLSCGSWGFQPRSSHLHAKHVYPLSQVSGRSPFLFLGQSLSM